MKKLIIRIITLEELENELQLELLQCIHIENLYYPGSTGYIHRIVYKSPI